MSDLQLSLLGMGALLVVGVWSYNKLQERKYRRAAEKVFRGEQPDVLVADEVSPIAEPVEPAASEQPAPVVAYAEPRIEPVLESEEENTRREPVFVQEEAPAAVATAAAPSNNPPIASGVLGNAPPFDWCDDSIDLLARISFAAGIDNDELRQAQEAMQGHQRVPVRIFARQADGWRPLADAPAGSSQQVCVALQLVDRRGAVSSDDFETLRHALQALAALREGELEFPDVRAISEQARILDEFCAQLDLQLALDVLDNGNGAFAGTKLRGLAEAAGMRLATNGEFQAHDENGNFLFALANQGEAFEAANLRNLQTHGLTFFLDVPHVRDGGYAFERMLSTARQFSAGFGASLVNAQRAPINDAMVDSIRKKISEIHEQMQIAGIPAGGVRALRLFA